MVVVGQSIDAELSTLREFLKIPASAVLVPSTASLPAGKSLKVFIAMFQGKRNMCFLGPNENCLVVAFVLGAKAVETALKSKLSTAVKEQVRESPQYPEGRGVRFVIKFKKDLAPAQMLLEIKKSR